MNTFWFALIFALAGAVALTIALIRRRTDSTRESFLLNNREVGLLLGAITVGACWMQAPATLASGTFAFQSWQNFLIFWVPNVGALVLAALYVPQMREVVPKGFNIPEYMGVAYDSGGMRSIVFSLEFLSLIGVMAFTLTGISQWLEPLVKPLFGVEAWLIAIVLSLVAFALVVVFGLPSALITDAIKLVTVTLGIALIGYLWWSTSGTLPQARAAPPAGLPWHEFLWISGIATAVSLIGGPLSNPDLGERNFAIIDDRRTLRNAYLGAAVFFGVATLAFGSLGVFAQYAIAEKFSGFPAFEVLRRFASTEIIMVASIGISLILMAALASYILSAGNLVANETLKRIHPAASDKTVVWTSRFTMLIPLGIATWLATTPGVSVPRLLESLAIIRGEMIVPVLIAAFAPAYAYSKAMGTGIIVGLVGGVVLTYAPLFGITVISPNDAKPLGALFALTMPLVFWLTAHYLSRTTRVAI